MRHIIQKQVFELALGPGVEAFGSQHAASRFFQDVLVPVLERIFDDLAGEGIVIRVDRLVLDLGRLDERYLNGHISGDQWYTILITQLRQKLNDGTTAGTERLQSRVSNFEQWWYYMEKGRLPWNATIVDADWYRSVLETLSVEYEAAGRLRQALGTQPAFRRRVSLQHPDRFLETLTRILMGTRQESLTNYVEAICAGAGKLEQWAGELAKETDTANLQWTEPGTRTARILRQWTRDHRHFLSMRDEERKATVWEQVLLAAAKSPEEKADPDLVLTRWLSEDEAIHQLLRESHAHPSPWSNTRSPLAIPKPEPSRPPKPEQPEVDQEKPVHPNHPDIAPVVRPEDPKSNLINPPPARAENPIPEHIPESAEQHPISPENRPLDLSRIEEDGLFGPYAGLILLSPFLTTFLSRCNLYSSDGFPDKHARQQAVFLLYYLATGEKEALEHELLFPKLLCGFDLAEEPFPLRAPQDLRNYAEADELLQMVLQRWEKLRESSIAALREGFLRRNGKLVNRGGRLVLMMESSAIDVLLDYLPWSLSIVKLPWIKELIYVEWR
jgi:hypothetical protein